MLSSFAAGIIWAIGRINFLSDPAPEPSMTQAEFARAVGVSVATISAKCREIWDGLELMQLNPEYTLASRLDSNPMIWMAEINGFIVDLRSAPRELQEAAFEQGLIPYIPANEAESIGRLDYEQMSHVSANGARIDEKVLIFCELRRGYS